MNRSWCCLLLLTLGGCEPAALPPPSTADEEAVHMETETIRKALDDFKSHPGREQAAMVESAFAEFDEQVQDLEDEAKDLTGEDLVAIRQRIDDLKHRREIHWARCRQTAFGGIAPGGKPIMVRRALPVR